MKLKIYFIALFALALVFSECKKKKKVIVDPAPTTYTDVCTGNSGNAKYIPLTVGNTWTYGPTAVISKLDSTAKYFGNTYFVASYSIPVFPRSYQRYVANGDLVGLNPDSLAVGKFKEEILVPGSPAASQTWTDSKGVVYTVVSINASQTTTKPCTYSGLLYITAYDATAGSTTGSYYKKGVGLVYVTCSGSCVFSSEYLNTMTIY
jgi:hypothetical protein